MTLKVAHFLPPTTPMHAKVIAPWCDKIAAESQGRLKCQIYPAMQLGGTPPLEPADWYKLTNCGYDAPKDEYVRALLDQNIKGEQCAIMTYKKLLKLTEGKDPVTNNIVLQILQDEVEHEEDLQAEMEDLEDLLKVHGRK